jgi:hypothetical protein
MIFYQASAPTGWTKTTGINDKLLYITDGTGANPAGGTNNTGTGGWDNSWGITVGSHSLTQSEIPLTLFGSPVIPNTGSAFFQVTTQTSAGHSHTISSSSQWRPPALYVIVASKN